MYIKTQQLNIPYEVICKVYLQSLVRKKVWKALQAFSTTTWKCPLIKLWSLGWLQIVSL